MITVAFTVSAMSKAKNATIAKDRNDRTKSAIITSKTDGNDSVSYCRLTGRSAHRSEHCGGGYRACLSYLPRTACLSGDKNRKVADEMQS